MPTSPRPSEDALPLVDGLTRDYLLHHRVCPRVLTDDDAVVVAVASDASPDALRDALDDIALCYRRRVETEHVTGSEVERLIERLTTRSERVIELARVEGKALDDSLATDVRDLANQPPVVRYVNLLVRDAHDAAAIELRVARSGTRAAVVRRRTWVR